VSRPWRVVLVSYLYTIGRKLEPLETEPA